MGMFNTVIFNCPKCGESFEGQSKTGCCSLKTFHQSNVPVADVSGLVDRDGLVYCSECSHPFRLNYPRRFSLHLSSAEDNYDYD